LQDILVDETARFGDAVTRSTLKGALVEITLARATATALRAPTNFVDQSDILSTLLPDPLRKDLVDNLSRIPDVIDDLLSLNSEDEKILLTAEELCETLAPLISNAVTNAGDEVNEKY